MGSTKEARTNLRMGKSLNDIGKTAGKQKQMLDTRQKKLEMKEDFKKFFDSYPVNESPADWSCSACDFYYNALCKDRDIHEKEWEEKSREVVRKDIYKDYKKACLVEKSKNKAGYKTARKWFQDDYFGDFILPVKQI